MIQSRIAKIAILFTVLASVSGRTAVAESIIVCGSQNVLGVGTEVTLAQWLPGSDVLAPVVKQAHWRILHRKVTGPFCPAFEVETSQEKVYIKFQSPDGTIVTTDQYSMFHLDTSTYAQATGDYQLFLDTVPRSADNIFTSYKVPSIKRDDGQIVQSPTIGLSLTGKWEESFPLRAGFEAHTVDADTSSILIE